MATRYIERLKLPVDGCPDIEFRTHNGLLIARGYERIVLGQRGPYIEFKPDQIVRDNITIPEAQKWRLTHPFVFYNEHRSKDYCSVKLYEQKRTVEYADYKVGFWYVSPFQLSSNKYPVLIEPLKRGRYKTGKRNGALAVEVKSI